MPELATYILQKMVHAKHSKSSPESNPGPTKEEQVSTLKSKAQKRSMNQLHKKNAQGKGTLTIWKGNWTLHVSQHPKGAEQVTKTCEQDYNSMNSQTGNNSQGNVN